MSIVLCVSRWQVWEFTRYGLKYNEMFDIVDVLDVNAVSHVLLLVCDRDNQIRSNLLTSLCIFLHCYSPSLLERVGPRDITGIKHIFSLPSSGHLTQNTSSRCRLLLLLRELDLGNALTHRTRAAHTAGDHPQQPVHIFRPTPLLVRDYITSNLDFRFLDQLPISPHASLHECRCELVGNQGGRVQTREGDELPAVAEFAETGDVGFLFGGGHGALPVE